MSGYFEELKRRNVFRVGAAYAVVGWLIIEVVDTVAPRMAMPDWVPGFFIILVLIGFPIALLFSWAFEMTPEGLKKSAEVDTRESITATTGQKINYFIIAALAAVVLFQQFAPSLSTITRLASDDAEPITIAVLPFADLSSGGDQEYLGDGVAEEILNVLAAVDGLKVTSRTSAFAFKDQNLSIPEIASVLGVSHVVEGSVRKQDDQVRITAQLIEVADDAHLWSNTYDSALGNIFQLQDEIADSISAALSRRLGLALTAGPREIPDWDIAAYELYLRARQLVVARRDMESAVTLLDTALQIEPEFADAWAEKAAALALRAFDLGLFDATVEDAFDTYDEAWVVASRAIEINPGHALGLAVQGLVRLNQKRFIEARVLFERALGQSKPSDYAHLWLGIQQSMTGDFDGALATFDVGLRESPTAPNLVRWRNYTLAGLHRWQEVWDRKDAHTGVVMAETALIEYYAGLHLGEVSVDEFAEWMELDVLSLTAEERALFARVARVIKGGSDPDLVEDLQEAILVPDNESIDLSVYAVLPGLADSMLNARVDRMTVVPNRNLLPLAWRAEATGFRRSPEALALFRDLGLPAYWDLYGWPDMCRRTSVNDFICD